MKNKKRTEIILKVIEIIYNKNHLDMRESINTSIIEDLIRDFLF